MDKFRQTVIFSDQFYARECPVLQQLPNNLRNIINSAQSLFAMLSWVWIKLLWFPLLSICIFETIRLCIFLPVFIEQWYNWCVFMSITWIATNALFTYRAVECYAHIIHYACIILYNKYSVVLFLFSRCFGESHSISTIIPISKWILLSFLLLLLWLLSGKCEYVNFFF